MERLDQNIEKGQIYETVNTLLHKFSYKGLRTLVYAMKALSEDEY